MYFPRHMINDKLYADTAFCVPGHLFAWNPSRSWCASCQCEVFPSFSWCIIYWLLWVDTSYIHIHPGSPADQEFGLKWFRLLIRLFPEISPRVKILPWSGFAQFSPKLSTTWLQLLVQVTKGILHGMESQPPQIPWKRMDHNAFPNPFSG